MGNEPVRKAKRWSTPGHGMLADARRLSGVESIPAYQIHEDGAVSVTFRAKTLEQLTAMLRVARDAGVLE